MTASVYEIPLVNAPQTFLITLAGGQYRFTLHYRDAPAGGWTLDITEANGKSIVGGMPLVTGADLLEPYAYLGVGGQLWVQTDADPDAAPTFENLGRASHLYFVAG